MELPKHPTTQAEAQIIYDSGWWKPFVAADPRALAEWQLNERRLCMPFGVFHKAVEKAIGRGVMSSEFAEPEHLRKELAAASSAE